MKPSNPNPATNSRFLTEGSGAAPSVIIPCVGLFILTLLCQTSIAQSATNFDTKPITPESAEADPNAAAETKVTAPEKAVAAVEAGPSRFVDETSLVAYVQSVSSLFSMSSRATDPFGQLQDPDAKPIAQPKVARTTRRPGPITVTPFAEIVERIQITTIMPGEHSFLVGTRSFTQGDRFPINFRGRAINVEVAAVSARKIEFRSLDNGETAAVKLNLLPVGMTPGNGQISTPGMVRDRANSPLEISP